MEKKKEMKRAGERANQNEKARESGNDRKSRESVQRSKEGEGREIGRERRKRD